MDATVWTARRPRPRHRVLLAITTTLALLASASLGVLTLPASAASFGDDLSQCANGQPGEPRTCTWRKGNLNAAHSQYAEGDSVAFRRVVSGLTPGNRYEAFVDFDTVNNGLAAYDYPTSWDRTEQGDPTEGVDGLDAGDEQRVTIDDEVYARPSADLGTDLLSGLAEDERELSIFGGGWGADDDGVTLHGYSDGGGADDPFPVATREQASNQTVTTTLRIRFTAQAETVVLAWGGHIAAKADWDPRLTAPRETQGSPYHMRNSGHIADLDTGDTGTAGNQDRSLKASAVLLDELNLSKAIEQDLPLREIEFDGGIRDVGVVEPGGAFTYLLVVTVGGAGGTARDVAVTDTLPDGFLVDAEGIAVDPENDRTCAYTEADHELTCTLGDIPAGEVVTIRVPVQAPAVDGCGLHENDAVLTADVPDVALHDSVLVLVDPCDPVLDLDKTASTDTVSVISGPDTVTYTLTAVNDADATATATGVVIEDTIPWPFRLTEATPTFQVFDHHGVEDEQQAVGDDEDCETGTTGEDPTLDTVRCDVGTLAPGQGVEVTVEVELADDVCGEARNDAVLTADGVDELRDAATIDVVDCPTPRIVPDEPGISLTKTADPDSVTIVDGEDEGPFEVTYTYLVENTGDTPLGALELEDDVIGDLTGQLLDALGSTTLAAGDEVSFDVVYTLTDDDIDAGEVANVAVVEGTSPAAETVRDEDDALVDITVVAPVVHEPDIEVAKAPVGGVSFDGDVPFVVLEEGETATVTYAFVVTNTGDEDLLAVTLVDDRIGDLTDELAAALLETFGETVLPVGGSVAVRADGTSTADDFEAGEITNVVVATAFGAVSGAQVSDDDTVTVFVVEILDVVEDDEDVLPVTGADADVLVSLAIMLASLGATLLLLAPGRRRAIL